MIMNKSIMPEAFWTKDEKADHLTKRQKQRVARHLQKICKIAAIYNVPVKSLDGSDIGAHYGRKSKGAFGS